MTPGWVIDLDDYWRWLEESLDSTGGFLETAYLVVQPAILDEGGPWLALLVDRQRLRFHDGSYLSFEFVVNDQLELDEYSFHYARADNSIVWRHDKHLGHEKDDGGLSHLHLPSGRVPEPETDTEAVLEEVRLDQSHES